MPTNLESTLGINGNLATGLMMLHARMLLALAAVEDKK